MLACCHFPEGGSFGSFEGLHRAHNIVGQDQGEKARVEGLSGSNCEKRIKDKIFSHLKGEDVPSGSSVL